MEKEFVPYELAVKLKELGFDEPCFRFYSERYTIDSKTGGDIKMGEFYLTDTPRQKTVRCKAPTFSQAFRWFREKHNLFGCIDLHPSTPIHWYIRIDDVIENDYIYHSEDEGLKFGTYEMGELACLDKLIEIAEGIESQK